LENRIHLSVYEAFARTLGDLSGLDAVDIGCGSGRVTGVLVSLGARVTGVEPNAEALGRARETVRARFVAGSGEATGLADAAFDIAVFGESLHHAQDRFAALEEAVRIVRPGGRIVVVEPQAPDPIYDVARFIDDEAPVYQDARNAIAAIVAQGRATRRPPLLFAGKYRVASPQGMLNDMCAVDAGRSLDEADRPAYEKAFYAALRRDEEGPFLPYWQRLDILHLQSSSVA
jgi:ubiquinone/menaquinone biosynthesis C-methylase UbiE